MTRATFQEYVIGTTDLTVKDADRILDWYVKRRYATVNAHDGYQVKHGGLMDADVLERTAQESLLRA
jgi:hypothetical protein